MTDKSVSPCIGLFLGPHQRMHFPYSPHAHQSFICPRPIVYTWVNRVKMSLVSISRKMELQFVRSSQPTQSPRTIPSSRIFGFLCGWNTSTPSHNGGVCCRQAHALLVWAGKGQATHAIRISHLFRPLTRNFAFRHLACLDNTRRQTMTRARRSRGPLNNSNSPPKDS